MKNGIDASGGKNERGATVLSPQDRTRLEQVEGFVFNIQRYSLHDGPGVRTNVFFKGCPLHCSWCANPESQYPSPELELFEHQCIQCGLFQPPCPVGWGSHIADDWTEDLCEEYAARANACSSGAMHWVGERRSAGSVMAEVLRDAPFYDGGGGMTLTGGEPTMQPDMTEALLRLSKSEGISTAIETCGHSPWRVLERLYPFLDLILFDVKHMDSEIHRAFTGVGNELILSNLRRLAALNVPLTARVPLIPGFNATQASVKAIARFISELNGAVNMVDLLPYHALGKPKYEALGRDYDWADQERLTEDQVAAFAGLIESYGLVVSTGG